MLALERHRYSGDAGKELSISPMNESKGVRAAHDALFFGPTKREQARPHSHMSWLLLLA
jgi:hypothetical protein